MHQVYYLLGDKPNGRAYKSIHKSVYYRITKNEQLKNTPLINYGNENITGFSYVQAMVMFSTLYYWLGENTFSKLIGGFYQQYYQSGTSTNTFTDYCIKYGKEKRLKVFFDDWIYTTDYIQHLSPDATIDSIVAVYKK